MSRICRSWRCPRHSPLAEVWPKSDTSHRPPARIELSCHRTASVRPSTLSSTDLGGCRIQRQPQWWSPEPSALALHPAAYRSRRTRPDVPCHLPTAPGCPATSARSVNPRSSNRIRKAINLFARRADRPQPHIWLPALFQPHPAIWSKSAGRPSLGPKCDPPMLEPVWTDLV